MNHNTFRNGIATRLGCVLVHYQRSSSYVSHFIFRKKGAKQLPNIILVTVSLKEHLDTLHCTNVVEILELPHIIFARLFIFDNVQ